MIISRRKFFLGASALLVAPAIVRVESLMPVKYIIDLHEADLFFVGINQRASYRWRALDSKSEFIWKGRNICGIGIDGDISNQDKFGDFKLKINNDDCSLRVKSFGHWWIETKDDVYIGFGDTNLNDITPISKSIK